MNIIIPNELSFDFDLNDLPARATQVSSEALNLPGGGCGDYAVYNIFTTGRPNVSKAAEACPRVCRPFGLKFNGNFRDRGPEPGTGDNWTGKYMIICGCCK